jgi:16S rRNA (guanine527-N7)-methyltransferase
MTLLSILEESQARGFLGPGPIQPHIDRALAAAPLLAGAGTVLDMGSGGGLPGLPLIEAGAGERWGLLDGSDTRCAFLGSAVARLGRGASVAVICGRAEEIGRDPQHRHQWDAVIARSFGPPAVTAECAAPLLRTGGLLVVAEPPLGSGERWPVPGLAQLGLVPVSLVRDAELEVGYQVLRQESRCDSRFPRRTGVPAKRPLF